MASPLSSTWAIYHHCLRLLVIRNLDIDQLIKLASMLSNSIDVKQATNSKHVIWVPFSQCDHCVVGSKI